MSAVTETAAPRHGGIRALIAVIASPKMLAILVLGAASGFPNQITESTLQAWLKQAGASNTLIGTVSYVGLPYLFKVFWAPLIDRYPVPLLGRRRGWMLVTQMALVAAIAALAGQNPATSVVPISLCALMIAFCSATQDVAYDAYRTDVALPQERGLAAAAQNFGYRAAAYLASAGALVIAGHFGWHRAFVVLATVMLTFCVATLLAPEPQYAQQPPRTLAESVTEPLRELLSSPGAMVLIGVVLLFKVGDAFANKLFTPFMIDVGFSLDEIGTVIKAIFTSSAIVGALLGGVFMVRLGLLRSMLAFGVLQAVSNLLYCVLAVTGKSYPVMVAAVALEHIAGAMGGIALVALIMAMCDPRYSAFQYALLSAIALLPRYSLGYPAGWIADHAGWYAYYVVSFALAVPGLAMVYFNRRRIDALDRGAV